MCSPLLSDQLNLAGPPAALKGELSSADLLASETIETWRSYLIGTCYNMQSVHRHRPGRLGYRGVTADRRNYQAQMWFQVLPSY
jgi:hypothetical protein